MVGPMASGMVALSMAAMLSQAWGGSVLCIACVGRICCIGCVHGAPVSGGAGIFDLMHAHGGALFQRIGAVGFYELLGGSVSAHAHTGMVCALARGLISAVALGLAWKAGKLLLALGQQLGGLGFVFAHHIYGNQGILCSVGLESLA